MRETAKNDGKQKAPSRHLPTIPKQWMVIDGFVTSEFGGELNRVGGLLDKRRNSVHVEHEVIVGRRI